MSLYVIMTYLMNHKEGSPTNTPSVNKRQQKALQKIKSYNPDLNKITSECEAQVHEQFLTDAIRRLEMLKETTADAMNKFVAEESLEASRKRKLEGNDYCHQKTTLAP